MDKETFVKHRLWFVIFDFRHKKVLAQYRIFIRDDRVNYVPKICVAACSEISKSVYKTCHSGAAAEGKDETRIHYAQNYQVAVNQVH